MAEAFLRIYFTVTHNTLAKGERPKIYIAIFLHQEGLIRTLLHTQPIFLLLSYLFHYPLTPKSLPNLLCLNIGMLNLEKLG